MEGMLFGQEREREKGEYIQMYTKSDFIAGNLGRGLKWNEDPGMYIKNLVHLNQASEEKQLESGGKFEENIPFFN